MSDLPQGLIYNDEFMLQMGMFVLCWGDLEIDVSYGITRLLNVNFTEGHMLTSGMEFGRKAALLRNLVYRSTLPNKREIIRILGKIQNESKRNVFAHAFTRTTLDTVIFIDRSRGGDYKVAAHEFTLREFMQHVNTFTHDVKDLSNALGISTQEHHDFAMAALNEATKSTKSPAPPKVKA